MKIKDFTSVYIFILMVCVSGAVHINEIMYNPPGNDNNKEYIEIYSEDSLVNWTIGDLSSNDTLELLQWGTSYYALIVEDDFEYVNDGTPYYTAGSSIGNNLNNGNDELFLYNQEGELMDAVSYDGSLANDNGRSLELIDNRWVESAAGGSPGKLNPEMEAEAVLCELDIIVDKQVYEINEQVSYRITQSSGDYDVEYWIEDALENTVKERRVTTSSTAKTWTPNCDLGDVFVLKAEACNQTAEELVVVKCPKQTLLEDIEILDAPQTAKFGETTKIKLHVTKGDSAKSVVEVFAESDVKISEVTKIYLTEQQSLVSVTVPLILKPNCNGEFDDGYYDIVVTGLDVKATAEVYVEGNDECEVETEIIEVCPEFECTSVEPELKSFYTRQQKYSDEVRLYAGIDCPYNCTLVLSAGDLVKTKSVSEYSGTVEFNVPFRKKYDLALNMKYDVLELTVPFEEPEEIVTEDEPQAKSYRPVYQAQKQSRIRNFIRQLFVFWR